MDKNLLKHTYLLLLAYYGFLFYTQYEEGVDKSSIMHSNVKSARLSIERLKKKEQELNKYITDIEHSKSKITKINQTIQKIKKQLPSKHKITENFQKIKDLAIKVNIKKINLTHGKESVRDFYNVATYKFNGEGTYLQFLFFLEQMKLLDTLFNIKTFKLTQLKKKQRGRFKSIKGEITLETFAYDPNKQAQNSKKSKKR